MRQYDVKYQLDEEKFFLKMHLNIKDSLNEQIRKAVYDLKPIAEQFIHAQAWYLEENSGWCTGIKAVDHCEKKIICLIYIEQNAVDILEEREKKEDYLEGYILHELINDMLFYTSDQLYNHLEKQYEEEGSGLTKPFFPGENGVPLELQRELLSRMKKEKELQIDISCSYMLVPEKALLYVVGADKKNERIKWKHDCSMCDKIDCYLRNADDNNFQEEL